MIDPPYYDNVMYAELSDFFYVWLKRTAGQIMPELFRQALTDKDHEAVANPAKFKGQKAPRYAFLLFLPAEQCRAECSLRQFPTLFLHFTIGPVLQFRHDLWFDDAEFDARSPPGLLPDQAGLDLDGDVLFR